MQNFKSMALKQVAVCLPPVILSLIGLAALSRKKGSPPLAANRPTPSAAPRTARRSVG
ncbi:MAG: hypothetical protein U1E42_06660 [Rhodospirillales bacterium]